MAKGREMPALKRKSNLAKGLATLLHKKIPCATNWSSGLAKGHINHCRRI
jgi:hypothetical protein